MIGHNEIIKYKVVKVKHSITIANGVDIESLSKWIDKIPDKSKITQIDCEDNNEYTIYFEVETLDE